MHPLLLVRKTNYNNIANFKYFCLFRPFFINLHLIIVRLIRDMKCGNRANCDKSMKLGENTQFGMLNKI